jgi:hypothetical protein
MDGDLPMAKPMWLKLPTPPETEEPYCHRIASYSCMLGEF